MQARLHFPLLQEEFAENSSIKADARADRKAPVQPLRIQHPVVHPGAAPTLQYAPQPPAKHRPSAKSPGKIVAAACGNQREEDAAGIQTASVHCLVQGTVSADDDDMHVLPAFFRNLFGKLPGISAFVRNEDLVVLGFSHTKKELLHLLPDAKPLAFTGMRIHNKVIHQ